MAELSFETLEFDDKIAEAQKRIEDLQGQIDQLEKTQQDERDLIDLMIREQANQAENEGVPVLFVVKDGYEVSGLFRDRQPGEIVLALTCCGEVVRADHLIEKSPDDVEVRQWRNLKDCQIVSPTVINVAAERGFFDHLDPAGVVIFSNSLKRITKKK